MRRVVFFVGAALLTACGASQARPATSEEAIAANAPGDRDPGRRCIRKVKVVGAAWAADYAPVKKGEKTAHNWGRTLSCPRGGAAIGPW
jgi:hypothetical protein